MAGTDQKAGSDGPNSGGGVVENKAHEHPQAPAAAASEAYVEEVHLNPLPPAPKSLAGSSHVKGQNYRVEVSNKSGYLCHLSLESTWDLPPEVLFSIFTYPGSHFSACHSLRCTQCRSVCATLMVDC